LIVLVGSSMDAPIDNSALARRRAIVKKRRWECLVLNRKRVHTWIVWRTGATWLTDRINVIHNNMYFSFTTTCIDAWWKEMWSSDVWLLPRDL
jgi:hypothetical protein